MPESRPARASFLPFSRPTIGPEEIDEVVDCLRSGWLTTGPKVARLEEAFAQWSGGQEAVAVNSATAGLHLALLTLNLAPDDEVITTSITWPSTVNNIEICGATSVLADVDKDTLQIDPYDIEKRITARTKCVIPVHFSGAPCDLDPIKDLCRSHGLSLVEDAAHAVGTRYKDRLVGADSEVAVFSFHMAAIGLHQFPRLEALNARRASLAVNYYRLLQEIPAILPLGEVPYPHHHAWHLFVVRLDLEAVTISRDHFLQALEEEKIGTGFHFPCIHLQKYYRERYGYRPGDLPQAEWNSARLFSLPLYPLLTEADQEDMVAAIHKVLKRYAR